MPVGTTTDFLLKRNELILAALRKITKLNENEQVGMLQLDAAIKALNMIIRQEDQRGTDQAKNLWALSEAAVFIRAGGHIYGVNQGLKNNIRDLVSIVYRDRAGGDCPVDLVDARRWGRMPDHKDIGEPQTVYFKRDRLLANQQFFIDRAPTSIGTTNVVTGTDTFAYQCILGHTAADENRPITGASWPLYWQLGGSGAVAWASSTVYTNGELLYYVFKRPLFDFDLPTDNPDVPAGWEQYLIYRLAIDLAPEYQVSPEKMQMLRVALTEAREILFPSARSGAEDYHNLTEYF
jgi:hypothetical protein